MQILMTAKSWLVLYYYTNIRSGAKERHEDNVVGVDNLLPYCNERNLYHFLKINFFNWMRAVSKVLFAS